jgi:transposase
MPQPFRRIESVIGLDVSQASVVLHDRLSGQTLTIPNDPASLLAALEPLRDRALAICEATGGHEDKLLAVLHGLAIPTHRGDGGRISAFAASLGRAKTDAIDARMLARYGAERGDSLPLHAPVSDSQRRLTALVRRRMELVEARKIERTRAKAPRAGLVEGSIARALAFLDQEIDTIEAEIESLCREDQAIASRQAALRSIPGIGPTIAPVLLGLLPELGRTTRRRAAALAAVAPHPRDSGKTSRHRTTTGGRRAIRPVLFIAALTAARGETRFAAFYRKLVQAGKPKRLALVALMRKIVVVANARLAQVN